MVKSFFMSLFVRLERYIAGTIRKKYLKRPILVCKSPLKRTGDFDHKTDI